MSKGRVVGAKYLFKYHRKGIRLVVTYYSLPGRDKIIQSYRIFEERGYRSLNMVYSYGRLALSFKSKFLLVCCPILQVLES